MSDLVFVNHLILLHLLYGYDLACLAISAHAHLAKGTTSNDLQRLKVLYSDLSTRHTIEFGLFVLNFLLNELFLLLAQVHLLHLYHKLVPRFLLLHLFIFLLRILRLNVGFHTLGTLLRTIRWFELLSGLRLLLLLLVLLL